MDLGANVGDIPIWKKLMACRLLENSYYGVSLAVLVYFRAKDLIILHLMCHIFEYQNLHFSGHRISGQENCVPKNGGRKQECGSDGVREGK